MTGAPFDLLVVGAGGAGLSCAIAGAESGLRVALIEQASDIGGTLHVAGGMMSGAGTRRQQQKGITGDTVERHLDDVQKIAHRGFDPEIQRLAVMAAPGLIDWIDELGFPFHPDAPAIYFGHEPYSVPRTYWGPAAGKSLMETLRKPLQEHLGTRRITLYLRHVMNEIEAGTAGATGIVVTDLESGGTKRLLGSDVVIATGGFGSNADLFARTTGLDSRPPAASMPGSQGGGLKAILALGGQLRPATEILRLGRFPEPGNSGRVDYTMRADLEALMRPPREIWVNQGGRRFVDESADVVTVQEHAVLKQPGAMFWAIFDRHGVENGTSLVREWKPETYSLEAERGLREIWCATAIAELADQAGIDRQGLENTVAEWNSSLTNGTIPWSTRCPTMRIDTPPYFALLCRGSILATFTGIVASPRLEVIGADNRPIHHLFAIGETLGGATYTGEAFCGGMLVTPALALGRELGKYLGRRPSVLDAAVTPTV